MKKLFLLAALLFSMSLFAQEQGDDNGFELKFQVGLGNSGKYGMPKGLSKIDKLQGYNAKVTFGGTMANRWYLGYPGNMGIALQAKWLEINGGKGEETIGGNLVQKMAFYNVDALGAGAILSFYLSDNIALDVTYNIAPSLFIIREKGVDEKDRDDDHIEASFGPSHTFGLAFRVSVFEVGADFKLYNPTRQKWFNNDEEVDSWGDLFDSFTEKQKINANKLRVFVGLKF